MNEVNLDTLQSVLQEYIEKVVPAMLRQQYHLILVKGGPLHQHLPEQSHFTHIINGVFGLCELLKFLIQQDELPYDLSEDRIRKALALFTIHEVHKAHDLERMDTTEFSIPLERLREEYERLGLSDFARVDEHLMRAANVHKRSPRQGDLLLSPEDGTLIWLLIRLADAFASAVSPSEAQSSLMTYLPSLGPAFLPKSPPGRYAIYHHEIKDVRGVLTNVIHRAVTQEFGEKLNLFPLLYFPTGTLYIGPSISTFNRDDTIQSVTERVMRTLVASGDSVDAIRDGLRRQKFDFEQYIYAFAPVERLLEIVYEETKLSKPDPNSALKEINGLIEKRKDLPQGWGESLQDRFGIELYDPKENKAFNEHWSQVRRYLLYVDTLLRDLLPGKDRLEWLLETFELPVYAAENLRSEREIWGRGGLGKYVLVVAFHFLRGADFADRACESLPAQIVLERLHRRILGALTTSDTDQGRRRVLDQLGFREDLFSYLDERLTISFAPGNQMHEDNFAAYTVLKRKGHSGKVCSLCNRSGKYVQELRTGILDDFGRVFSNRVLPAKEAPGMNRSWCPVCHLEFIFRKLNGMGLPAGAHYKKSYRIYLYILPTYSFTAEHGRLLRRLLKPFRDTTNINVRDYGPDWGIPHRWLLTRAFDPEWTKELQEALEKTAEKIAQWGGRSYIGERITTLPAQGQNHYYLLSWEKPARESDTEDSRLATRTEAWAKAVFAATIISSLTSCKVYVTEQPYLPEADPANLSTTITLDSPPPALRAILGNRSNGISLYGREAGRLSGLEQAMDLSAALWMITTSLKPGKDKHISARLERANTDPLAGAFFYKEYGRENDGETPPQPFIMACEVLLKNSQRTGGDLMDIVERIAQKSLDIALPLRKQAKGRGKARRYELLFREAVSALREAQRVVPEIRQTSVTAKPPSPNSIREMKCVAAGKLLKGLERRKSSQRGEIVVQAWGDDLGRQVGEFIDLLVDEIYLGRAGGSMAQFIRLENSLADGIYYYTDRNLSGCWEIYIQEREKRSNTGQQTDSNEFNEEE